MSRFEKIALATAIVATLLGAIGLRSPAFQYYVDQMLSGSVAIFVLGWAVATYGPLALAVAFRRLAKRFLAPISVALHLLFLPCAIAIYLCGDAMMVASISDPDFDAMIGDPDLPAFLSLAVAIICYFVAALLERRPAKSKPAAPEGD